MTNLKFMLAKEYQKGMVAPKSDQSCLPPIGWIESEKFDGYRARFQGSVKDVSGKLFYSRANKVFNAPRWFINAMPPVDLDGELWVGRENFQSMGVVRKKIPIDEEWLPVKYLVYDLPEVDKPFSERIKELRKIVRNNIVRWNLIREKFPEPFKTMECPVIMAKQTPIKSHEHMELLYNDIIENGGEGIMLKDPNSKYEDKRSNYMLKYKPSFDEEAIIIDYSGGKGKYSGMLGGFVCRPLINKETYHTIDPDENHEFTISGMDDIVRENYKQTHPIGTIISFTHSGKTEKLGKPRFARYERIRDDIIIKDGEEPDKSNSISERDNIIHILNRLSEHERINGEAFKANSYLKAISSLKKINSDKELVPSQILKMDGIGKSIFQKVETILSTGSCPQYEKIKDTVDPRKLFMDIHGVGPAKANELIDNGFTTIDELIEDDHLLNETQKLGLKYYEDFIKKIPRNEIEKHEKILKLTLSKLDRSAHLTIAGSYRRGKVESGDIDVLIMSENKKIFGDFIKKLTSMGYLIDDLALGNKKYNGVSIVSTKSGNGVARRIDIMYTKPVEYPFAILYFTGSGDFNKDMRKKINDEGMTINEYSLKNSETKKPVDHVFKVEKDIFEYLGMQYVEPQNRL
jgi:DNA polymerase beta